MINTSKDLVEKVENLHDQMGHVRKEMETIRKNEMDVPGKNHIKINE